MGAGIYISYTSEDQAYLDELKTALEADGQVVAVSCWTADDAQWRETLSSVVVAFLMVTPDYLASAYIKEHELPALYQYAVEGKLTVLPMPYRAVDWRAHDFSAYLLQWDPKFPVLALSPAQRSRFYEWVCSTAKSEHSNYRRPSHHHYQPRPSFFVGRDAERATMALDLTGPRNQTVTLFQGPAGIGKTTLARELQYCYGVAFVAAIELRAECSYQEQVLALSAALKRCDVPRSPAEACATIRALLAAHAFLLLLEDAKDTDFLTDCLPDHGPSAILVTTRDPNLAHILAHRRPEFACRTIELGPFSTDECRALFQAALGENYRPADEAVCDAIGTLLDLQPGALRLAFNGLACPSHLSAAALQAKLEQATAPAKTEITVSELGAGPLATIFELVLSTLDLNARQALALLAQCAPGPVPLAFLSRMTETDDDELQEIFEQLARSHWCTASAGSYELHELLRCLARGQEPNPDLDPRFLRAVYDLYDRTELDQFLLKDACLPQLRQALALWQEQLPDLLLPGAWARHPLPSRGRAGP